MTTVADEIESKQSLRLQIRRVIKDNLSILLQKTWPNYVDFSCRGRDTNNFIRYGPRKQEVALLTISIHIIYNPKRRILRIRK